jgi:hypothetical protein
VVALALLVPAAASGKPVRAHGRPSGIVAPASQAIGLARSAAPAAALINNCSFGQTPTECNLDYQGGTVMHSSKTFAIYWVPSGFSVSTNYESLINRYLSDVATDSGRTTNVYSAATQFYDAAGPIDYSSTFGGSYVDTDPFPPSGCDDSYHGHKDAVCLTDQQIQDELQTVLSAKSWHGGASTMFFVMTPNGVGSCFDSTATDCTTIDYCAYHGFFTDSNSEPVIYGNEPYDATIPNCWDGTSPNSDDADATINTISHEHNEAITDPFLDAWWNFDSGQENGDNCAWVFGDPVTPGGDYNQVINGHHYWLQEEWSNDGSDCVQHYLGVPVNFGAPTVSGVAREGKFLFATPGTWSQSPTSYAYQWLRCSSASETSCSPFPGDTGSTYRLTANDAGKILRVAVYAKNAAGTSAPARSAPTTVVLGLPRPATSPVLSGVAAVDKTLSVTAGTWNTSAAFTYQWLRCAADGTGCSNISGATSTSYVAVSADADHVLRVSVTATNLSGTTRALSNLSGLVIDVPHATKAPRISGRVRVGKRLSASRGSWTGPPDGYRYQWLRCNSHGAKCRAIRHAAHSKYKLTKHDAGHKLRVRVTAADIAGSTTATSRATKRVPAVRRHRHR